LSLFGYHDDDAIYAAVLQLALRMSALRKRQTTRNEVVRTPQIWLAQLEWVPIEVLCLKWRFTDLPFSMTSSFARSVTDLLLSYTGNK
jgi:hypothetical protein